MTIMASEIGSIPSIVADQLDRELDFYLQAGRTLRTIDPACIVTCARGSSDHAALYFKYLVEMKLGIPVCSMGPSIASVYGARLSMKQVPMFAISQSGGSQDLTALMKAAGEGGAPTIALTNDVASPLAQTAEHVLSMAAGSELAVAATKTYVCSLVSLAAVTAGLSADDNLIDAIKSLPDILARSLNCDWSHAIEPLSRIDGLFVVSRGPALAIGQEAALKFKETCRLHAEAYSAAEVRHGPIALAGKGFTALAFNTRDAGATSILEAISAMRAAGARVFEARPEKGNMDILPTVAADHVLLDPISQIVSYYSFIEQLSVATGHDPDRPALLQKVTVTV